MPSATFARKPACAPRVGAMRCAYCPTAPRARLAPSRAIRAMVALWPQAEHGGWVEHPAERNLLALWQRGQRRFLSGASGWQNVEDGLSIFVKPITQTATSMVGLSIALTIPCAQIDRLGIDDQSRAKMPWCSGMAAYVISFSQMRALQESRRISMSKGAARMPKFGRYLRPPLPRAMALIRANLLVLSALCRNEET